MVTNIAAYRFVEIDDPDALATHLRTLAESLNLLGTVLVAREGLNLFLAGRASEIDSFVCCSEDIEEPNRFVVVANYADRAAGEAHVASEHAQWFFGWLPSVVARVPPPRCVA